jgi:hypothetical protein
MGGVVEGEAEPGRKENKNTVSGPQVSLGTVTQKPSCESQGQANLQITVNQIADLNFIANMYL